MKYGLCFLGISLIVAPTSPFIQDGSVDIDRQYLEERQEKAIENQRRNDQAKEFLEEQKENEDELEEKLDPGQLEDNSEKKEGAID